MKVCTGKTGACVRAHYLAARTDACVRDKTMSKVDCCVSRGRAQRSNMCSLHYLWRRRTDNPNPATAVDRLQLQQRWGAHENRLITGMFNDLKRSAQEQPATFIYSSSSSSRMPLINRSPSEAYHAHTYTLCVIAQ